MWSKPYNYSSYIKGERGAKGRGRRGEERGGEGRRAGEGEGRRGRRAGEGEGRRGEKGRGRRRKGPIIVDS